MARGPSTRRWPSARWQLWRAHDAKWQRGFFRKTGALWMLGEDAWATTTRSAARRSRRCAREKLPIEELTPQARREAVSPDLVRRHHQVRPLGARGRAISSRAARASTWSSASSRKAATTARSRRAGARWRSDSAASRRLGARRWHARSRRTRSSSRAVRGWDRLSRRGRQARDADAPGGLLLRHAAGRHRGSSIRRCRCGSTTASGSSTAFRAMRIADSRWRTTRPAPPSIRPTARATRRRPASRPRGRSSRQRFPALAGAPLLGSEVCQYEASPDSHFIIDRHPAASNVWIAGGGSGHGFKMGPAVGETRRLARDRTDRAPDPQFALARLAAPPAGGWEEKWS